ncbi:hypothetical protein BDR07DRAFT_1420342 [Suillus spraguei]|nr:hypothetical protein BDR07DRAFT_1420342 [Suillus spraguei]
MAQHHLIGETSQRYYNKGDVAVRPPDSTELHSLLPTGPNNLQLTRCDMSCSLVRDSVLLVRRSNICGPY